MSRSTSSPKSIDTINPSTGKVIATYDNASVEDVSDKIRGARMALQNWQKKGYS